MGVPKRCPSLNQQVDAYVKEHKGDRPIYRCVCVLVTIERLFAVTTPLLLRSVLVCASTAHTPAHLSAECNAGVL